MTHHTLQGFAIFLKCIKFKVPQGKNKLLVVQPNNVAQNEAKSTSVERIR
jgi:hypothetical protein